MNVLELIKTLGPKADAKKIFVLEQRAGELVSYVNEVAGISVGAIDLAEAFTSEKAADAASQGLSRTNLGGTDISVTVTPKTLADCGYGINWDSEFKTDGIFTMLPQLATPDEETVSFKDTITNMKLALKDDVDGAKADLIAGRRELKASEKRLAEMEKARVKWLAAIAAATGAKPKKKKPKPYVQTVTRKNGRVKVTKLPKKKPQKAGKQILQALKAASRKKKRK